METLESFLDPLCEPLPAHTLPPIDHGQEPDPEAKTAVIVCHGMGQQVRFQTLNDIVQLLRDEAARRDEMVSDVGARLVLFRNAAGVCTGQLGRAELTVTRADGACRRVHLYETYWAPLTEGKVTIRDVLWFLLSAGWHGTVAGFRGFRRLMFGSWVPLKTARGTGLMFLFALAVVLSLVLVNVTLAVIVAGNVLKGGRWPAFPNPMLVASVLDDLATLEIVALPLVLLLGAVHGWRNWFLRRNRFTNRRWHLPKWLEWLLVAWLWVALIATVWAGVAVPADLIRYRGATTDGRTTAWLFVLIAGIAFSISYLARFFLIQYLGDVVIYVSAYAVSKFQEVRDEIQRIGFEVGRAVYGLPQHYDRCLLVGHSLGSVVAYDLYNRMANEGVGTNWDVQGRTRLLLTFGSPLDKTAFLFRFQESKEADVREALAAAVQPMIADAANRPGAWINIWSPRDWISGKVDYYQRPCEPFVTNVRDPEAAIPILAHNQYWKNRELGRQLYERL